MGEGVAAGAEGFPVGVEGGEGRPCKGQGGRIIVSSRCGWDRIDETGPVSENPAMAHDIFISYRRNGGEWTAHYLYEHLVRDGYDVTFDIDTLRSGRFDEALLTRIDECTDFIVVLSKGCFDRSIDPSFPAENDWLRRELARALEKGKNVIPIMLRDFVGFPANLPKDIADVKLMNGPTYSHEYIDVFYKRLKNSFLKSQPLHHGEKSTTVPLADDPLAAAGIPALGKTVTELERTRLVGEDTKHFSAAMGYLRVLRYRSALRELRAIRDKDDPLVRFHEALLAFELDGEGDENTLEELCIAARDQGSTAAMIAFAGYHLNEIDAVPNGECIAWLKKAIELGNPDAYADLGTAYEDGTGVEKNPEIARLLCQKGSDAGSLTSRMMYCLELLLKARKAEDKADIAKVFRPFLTHVESIADDTGSTELFVLGCAWVDGVVFERNVRRGAQYLEKVIHSKGRAWIHSGDSIKALAYNRLGLLYLGSEDFEADAQKAVEYFRQAREFDKNKCLGVCKLAQCYEDGTGVAADMEKAMELYKEAANRGDAEAQRRLALHYFDEGPEQDVVRGRILLMQAAEGGDVIAEWVLGCSILRGIHFDRDISMGLSWLKKAADAGSPDAMNELGVIYEDGTDGVEANLEQGVQWYRRGAEAGSDDAMENLGVAYLSGNGVPCDVNEARKWLERAAENGSAFAECSLGSRFASGDFGEPDMDEAVKWWERAAEHGDAVAMLNLGSLYCDGTFPTDLKKAREWIKKAQENGAERAYYYTALDCLGLLETDVPDSFDVWKENPVPSASDVDQSIRCLKKARSWFGHPLEVGTTDGDLAGACNLWLARIARLLGEEDEAKRFYAQSVELGNEAAKKELASMTGVFAGIVSGLRALFKS